MNKDIKMQLNRIAQIVGKEFGVIDENGSILFCSEENAKDININITDEIVNESEDKDFYEKDGYSLLRYASVENTVYLYVKSTPSEDNKRLLQLAALAYENKEEIQKSIVNDFYQALLIDGPKAVNQSDLTQYGIISEQGFIVVSISISREDATSKSQTIVLLKGIFSFFEHVQFVSVNSQKFAIVCGISEQDNYGLILETAMTVKDMLASEIMVDSQVSAGSVVKKLSDIYISFKDAEIAREAGLIFDLKQKCYVYDKLGIERLVYGLPVRNCVSFLKETLGVEFLQDKSANELLFTVKTFLYNNQNVSESARALYIHRNTLVYRLDKFNKLTKLDSTRFEEGMKIGIALMIIRYLEKKAPGELEF